MELIPNLLDNPEVDDDASLLFDINKSKRNRKKDIGCEEFIATSKNNNPLKKSDVGPSYLSK